MAHQSSEAQRAAKTIVLGLVGFALAYILFAPLVHYAALATCGILLGIAFWSIASGLSRRAKLPYRVALGLSLLALLGAVVAFAMWTGPQLAAQLEDLGEAFPRGVDRGREWLEQSSFGRTVLRRAETLDDGIASRGAEMVGSVQRGVASGIQMLAETVAVILLGLFFAATPRRYVDGLLILAPRSRRERLHEVMRSIIGTLRSWLAARLLLMTVIGAAFGIGLALLGVPLAFPIGVLTGALAFIPYVGAVLALVPALAVAFLIGPEKALEVLVLYAGIQLAETNLLDPLVESRAVKLPPALVVIAQLVSVMYFGPVGVLIATPLLVGAVIAVRMLYVEDVLGEPARPMREPKSLWRTLRPHHHAPST